MDLAGCDPGVDILTILDRITVVGTWIYDNGPMLLGLGMIVAFGYFSWTRSVKGMLISGLGMVTSLLLGW